MTVPGRLRPVAYRPGGLTKGFALMLSRFKVLTDQKIRGKVCAVLLISSFLGALGLFFARFPDGNMLYDGNLLLAAAMTAAFWGIFQKPFLRAAAPGKILCLALALTGAMLLDLSAWHLARAMFQSEFGDETEKIVGGFFQAQGEKIYASYFSHHGIFPFMLGHLWALLVPVRDLAAGRLQGLIVYALPIVLFTCYPAGRSRLVRVAAPVIYLAVAAYAQEFWHMRYDEQGKIFCHGGIVMYQSYAGIFLCCALYLLIPIYFNGKQWLTPGKMIIAGGCLALTFFCGISYSVSVLLGGLLGLGLLLSAFAPDRDWRNLERYGGFFVLGGLIVLAVTLLYLLLMGSVTGYLEYHFYYNLKLYPTKLAGFGNLLQLFLSGGLAPEAFYKLLFFMSFMVFTIFAMLTPTGKPRQIWSFLLLNVMLFAIGLASVLRLGQYPFQDSTLIFIWLGVLVSAMYRLPPVKALAAGLLVTCGTIAFYTAAKLPDTYYERHRPLTPYENFINEITDDDDRVYLDDWTLYFNIPRRPTFYYWMREWIENYRGRAWLKPDFFLLDDLQKERPAVVRWSHAFDESYFAPEKNARLRYLRQNYLRLGKTPYLIAKETLQKHADLIKKYQVELQELTFIRTFTPESNPAGFIAARELHRDLALRGSLIPPPADSAPEAIGLYIHTFGRKADQLQGEYRIKVCDAGGRELLNQTRQVNTLTDKQWHYFKFAQKGLPATFEISTDAPAGSSFAPDLLNDRRYDDFSTYSDGEKTGILTYSIKYQP